MKNAKRVILANLTEHHSATDRLITQVLDPHYVEHDAYILFDKLMIHAKPWYEFNEKLSSIPRPSVSQGTS